MARVAFLGLGVMGAPMAGHLAAAGHEVVVWNRTGAKAEAWVASHKGALAASPRAAAVGADFVMACVGNDDDLRSVCLGPDGAFAGMSAAAVFVDHTTVSAQVTRELAGHVRFVDAPVSGGQAGAVNGQLSIMCGGAVADYAAAEPVMAAYARVCRRLGDTGAGQLAKMMNQICIAGLMQGLSEALAFGQKAGLDGAAVVEVISQGAAGSWQMANRHKTMLEDRFDFGFAVDWMRKDLGICLATADEIGASLPVTALVDQFYKDVQLMGGGRGGYVEPHPAFAVSVGRIIATDACVAEGAAWLCAQDARWAQAMAGCGPLPLRRQADGFGALLSAIVGQQVSIASANAIWARLEGAGFTDPAAMAVATDDDLRAVGLSRQKARYARALAQAGIDFDALRGLSDADVMAMLVAVPGIGAWTAEIYAMFALGRADVFAHGDLALQEAAKGLFGLDARPAEKDMRVMALAWSPWRSVAARILWAHYRVMKSREGIR